MPPSDAPTPSQSVALFDDRPFFERALTYGITQGLLGPERLAALHQEAPKGIVQIARYFGTEYLRPELEAARLRLVQLVSLHLEHAHHGNLHQAAVALRDHSLLSRSKAGADMLKALIAMPQSTHFGLQEPGTFQDSDKPLLAKWCQRPLADYRAELALRTAIAHKLEAARWWTAHWELDDEALHDADAEAVIRTGALLHATDTHAPPDWTALQAAVARLRRKRSPPALLAPADLPAHLHSTVQALCTQVQDDLAALRDPQRPLRKLLGNTPAFAGRYFWLEDPLAEADNYARHTSAAWAKATGGHEDEASLLTLMLCLACAAPPKTLFTLATAKRIARQLRKTGWQPQRATDFIREHAPPAHQDAYGALWDSFVQESQATLLDDHDHTLPDALALLARECHVRG